MSSTAQLLPNKRVQRGTCYWIRPKVIGLELTLGHFRPIVARFPFTAITDLFTVELRVTFLCHIPSLHSWKRKFQH